MPTYRFRSQIGRKVYRGRGRNALEAFFDVHSELTLKDWSDHLGVELITPPPKLTRRSAKAYKAVAARKARARGGNVAG